ncbi:tetratricopeptide repeat protein [bacterium]|jgi:tetratricopeptide (TPR) repeat protein|nr:tetratricopeptide repeat protein [bacterium]
MKKLSNLLIVFVALISTTSFTFSKMSSEQIKTAYYKSYNYEKMGNYDDAIKALKLIYKSFPEGYTVNYRLGYLYNVNQKYANAISHFKSAISASMYSIEPKLGLMLVQMTKGDYDAAEELGHQILNTDYYNYYANLRLAYVLRMQNKAELAEKVVLKMLSLYPIDIYFLLEYGILKMNAEDFKRAYSTFSDILILDPENVTANDLLLKINDTLPESKKKSN